MATQDAPQQQRYELVSTLGKGGMAEVFLGWMHSVGGLRRKVAIKRILPDLIKKQSQLFEQMFVDEARLAFQLEHDNIVRVYDVGQSSNTFFIVMEYVQGYDLKRVYEKLVERNQMMPLGVSLYIAAQVAAGLGYAHDLEDDDGSPLGLVHNDISPPNILIGRHGEVKIADFGLSDARSNDVVTPEGMVKGKFAYISPESTRDPSLVSGRSDLFSVGIVLWEIIAGRRLFQRDSDLETFQAVRDCVVPDIRSVRPDCPPGLVAILAKALAPDPANRYGSCRELFFDIQQFSVDSGIPLDRFQLIQLVNDLAGGRWEAFVGKRVDAAEQQEILGELGNLLPPGVATHLKTFVSGGSVVDDLEDADVDGDWVADVFDDVGFEDGEVGGLDDMPDIPGASIASVEPSPPPKISTETPVSSSSRAMAADPPRHTPSPAPAVPAPSQPMHTQESVQRALSEMQTQMHGQFESEFKNQKLMFIVWGGVAGLLIGTILGVVIGALT